MWLYPIRTFQIAPEEFEPSGGVSERSQALIKDAIETTRQEPVAEILLLIGWEHSATIENLAKMLSVLPIPIYLLPDTNVARYLDHRAITELHLVNAAAQPYTEYTYTATSTSTTLEFDAMQQPAQWDLDDVSVAPSTPPSSPTLSSIAESPRERGS
jgi:hypothetical protein